MTSTDSKQQQQQGDYKYLIKEDMEHLLHSHQASTVHKDALIFTEGQGATLKDAKGTLYIDAMGGYFNAPLGHGNLELAETAFNQMKQIAAVQNFVGYSNPSAIMLADRLVKLANRSGFSNIDSVYFTNGGAEAIETAYHVTLRYFELKGMKQKRKVVSLKNCYHGSTFAAASMNTKVSSYGWARLRGDRHEMFLSIDTPSELYVDKGMMKPGETVGQAVARQFEELIIKEGANNIAAFFVEPIQGDGGAVIYDNDFFPLARQICTKYDIMFVADEIFTFLKTGTWFAMSHWAVEPDIITVGKGFSSGYLPLGATLINKKLKHSEFDNVSKSHEWIHDFATSGNPVCCAVALRSLNIIEREKYIEKSKMMGEEFLNMLKDRLGNFPIIKDIRGKGLLIAIDFKTNIAKDVEFQLAHKEHVLVHHSSTQHTIIMSPPFVFTPQQMKQTVNALHNVLGSIKYSAQGIATSFVEKVKDIGM